ncbi:MAG: hypothetical protein WA071_26805 [Undibacterium umbellatum]|uniref:hypothetical protein n=1 Tax=Undibacterium umbellatum TaxID=2762300 RepID=UPI003BB5D1ED
MNISKLSLIILLSVGSQLPATSLAASPTNPASLITPKHVVAGKTQGEWSSAWWQWARSFDGENNSPVADKTGDSCHLKQEGPVWFLAGTYGTQRTIRTCTVPKGKYLYFPMINYMVNSTVAGNVSCKGVTEAVRKTIDGIHMLVLEIDGVRATKLEAHRQISPGCFDAGALTGGRVKLDPTAADGYYVMLKPLSPGKHTINFGGRGSNMSQAVTYTLIVE